MHQIFVLAVHTNKNSCKNTGNDNYNNIHTNWHFHSVYFKCVLKLLFASSLKVKDSDWLSLFSFVHQLEKIILKFILKLILVTSFFCACIQLWWVWTLTFIVIIVTFPGVKGLNSYIDELLTYGSYKIIYPHLKN